MSSRLFDEARRLISRAVIEALLPDGQWRSDGDYWVRSPLRADSNIGSFHITAEGLWKDFATDEGGDLIQLIQKMRGCSNVEAAEEIIRLGGGSPPERRSDRPAPARNREKVKPVVPVPAEALAKLNAYIRSEYAIQHYGEAVLGSKYCNAEGRVMFAVCRYERAGAHKHKTIRPYYWGEDGKWHEGQAMDHDRPLLHLPELLATPSAPVLVVEGERCAEVKVPGYLLVTWAGGSSAVTHTDWGPLAERDVVIWPDADGPGFKAAAAIKHRLPRARVLRIEGKPAGWDIADAQADGLDLPSFVTDCPALETSQEADKLPFALLGFDTSRHWFLPRERRIPYTIEMGRFTGSQLLELAPLQWWGYMGLVKDTGGIRVDQAQDWLMQRYKEEHIGMVDLRRLRGAGVWRDAGAILVNDGKQIVTREGERCSYEEFRSEGYEYIPSETRFGEMVGEEATDAEGEALMALFSSQRFARALDPILLLGWALIAPFGGLLSWRPHLWLTGKKGTGKSQVILALLVDPLLGEFAHYGVGRKTTEAGLRRSINMTAKPVRLDEMEAKSKRDQEHISSITNLPILSAQDTSAVVTMASGSEATVTFIVRSCFLFASVNRPDDDAQVQSRFVQVEKLEIGDVRSEMQRMACECSRVMRDPGRYRRRMFRAVPRVLADIAAVHGNLLSFLADAREADLIAPLLAAAWAVRSRESLAGEAGTEWIGSLLEDLHTLHADRVEDEDRVMEHICAYKVRLEGGRDRAVAELLQDADMPTQTGETDAVGILSRHGLRLSDWRNGDGATHRVLAIAVRADPVTKMLEGTPYAAGYEAQLQRHPLAVGSKNVRLAIGVHRCRLLDWERFSRKYLSGADPAQKELEGL